MELVELERYSFEVAPSRGAELGNVAGALLVDTQHQGEPNVAGTLPEITIVPVEFETPPAEVQSGPPEREMLPDSEIDVTRKKFKKIISDGYKKEVTVDDIDKKSDTETDPEGDEDKTARHGADINDKKVGGTVVSPEHKSDQHEHKCEQCDGCHRRVSKSHPNMWCHQKANHKLIERKKVREKTHERQKKAKKNAKKNKL